MATHVIVEGSSTANGFGDEPYQGGFVGRIDAHLRRHYEDLVRRKVWTKKDGWCYLTNYSQAGRLLPDWAELVPSHMDENLRRSRLSWQTARLGIFVLAGHPGYLENTFDKSDRIGGTSLLERWRDSLEIVKDECVARDVHALFVQMPPPLRKMDDRGLEVHAMLTKQVLRTCASMDDGESTFVSVEAMLEGQDIRDFTYEDDMHPNARCHELIYRRLVPLVYNRLGIEPHQPLPDPAELLEPQYTI